MMDVYVCGYNGFRQLNFTNLKLPGRDIYVKHVDDTFISEQFFVKPFILLSVQKALSAENWNLCFTWSRCIASINLPGDKCVTLVGGFDSNETEEGVGVLDNLWCVAAQEQSLLLRENDNPLLIKFVHNLATKPVPVVVGSDENEAPNLELRHIAGGHRDFITIYNGVSLGKFSLPDSSQGGDKSKIGCGKTSSLEVKICHIDFVPPITKVCCGKEHAILLTQSGSVYSYGLSSRGQLGHGEIERESSPRLIDALDGLNVTTIAAGGWHSAAVSEIGDLYVWGWNESGQLGLISNKQQGNDDKQPENAGIVTVPFCIDLPDCENVTDVACGSRHTVVLTETGHVLTCGWNKYGQLGVGDTNNRMELTTVDGLTCCKIFAGHWNSAFVCKHK